LFLGEVGKLLGAKWKELDDGEKAVRLFCSHYLITVLTFCPQPYLKMAEKDKERAENEKAGFDVSLFNPFTTSAVTYTSLQKKGGASGGDDEDDD
jgi:hypothetical protein